MEIFWEPGLGAPTNDVISAGGAMAEMAVSRAKSNSNSRAPGQKLFAFIYLLDAQRKTDELSQKIGSEMRARRK